MDITRINVVSTDNNNVITVVPVVLCGGSGTRLWPLSRANYPKQFLNLSGFDGKSLFQQTILRLAKFKTQKPALSLKPAVVVANEAHRFLVLDQLHQINTSADIILEPVGKNTAPSLTLASLHIKQNYGDDAIMLVLSADHYIADADEFCSTLEQAVDIAHNEKAIVNLGIKPNKPATGYGYIKYQHKKGRYKKSYGYPVLDFVEKPDLSVANDYLKSGNYVWNAGIFILSAGNWIAALKQLRIDIYESTLSAWQEKKLDTPFIRPSDANFAQVPNESIDYAVMEKCAKLSISVRMVELNTEWSDLGTWQAVAEQLEGNILTTVIKGDVLAIDTENSYIQSSSRLVATLGVKDLIIIETPDAVLIADKSASQDVKKIVAQLTEQNRSEQCLHRKVHRPWGWYDSIDEGERFKVKRICVKPGASLSLQKHHHRAEHWVIVKGTAEVTCGDEVTLFTENQSTYIPLGEVHRLKNPGTIPLEIVEVQSGSYLEEDDIVRLDDVYGRTKS